MKKICFIFLGFILFVSTPAYSDRMSFATAPFHFDPDNLAIRDLEIPFETGSLPNGVRFVLHVDRTLPLVHLNEWFNIGSRDENGKAGITHLIEHLLFREPASSTESYYEHLGKIGARSSGANGFSSDDQVVLAATVPSGRLEALLNIESSRLKGFCDSVNPRKVALEKEIIKNEFYKKRMGQNTLPQWDLVRKYLYPAVHPYFRDGNGLAELEKILSEDVKAFYAGNFTGDRLTLALTGNFDPVEARRLISTYFSGIFPSFQDQEMIKRFPIELSGCRVLEMRGCPGFRETSCRIFPLPGKFEREFNAIRLAMIVLDGGQMGRFREIERREDRKCRLFTDLNGKELCSELLVGAEVLIGVPLEAAEKILRDEMERLSLEGPSIDELRRAKALWLGDYLNSLQTPGSRAYLLNSFLAGTGNPADWKNEITRTLSVTAEEVRDAVRQKLTERNSLVIRTVRPASSSDEPGKTIPDVIFSPPEIFEKRLGNGFTVIVNRRKGLPKIAVDLVIKAGSMFDAEGKEGTAYIAAIGATRGAADIDRERIGLELDGMGASIEEWVRLDGTGISMGCLRDNLVQAVEILSKIVLIPWYEPQEIDILRREIQTGPANDDARFIQNAVFAGNPFLCRPVSGTQASRSLISSDDLKRFHGLYWRPEKSALIFSGDIDPEQAVFLGMKFFGAWEAGSSAPDPALATFTWPAAGSKRVFLVDRFQSNQVRIFQILPAPVSGIEDSLAFSCWQEIHRQRLLRSLRETKGWCYDVAGRVMTGKVGNIGYIRVTAPQEKSGEVLKELDAQLKAFSSQGPVTVEELRGARSTMLEGFPQEFESCSGVGSRVALLWLLGKKMPSPDRIAGLNELIIKEVQTKFASFDKAIYLLQGGKDVIEKAVSGVGLGEFQWLNLGQGH